MKTTLYVLGGLAVLMVAALVAVALYVVGDKIKEDNTQRTEAARKARWAKPIEQDQPEQQQQPEIKKDNEKS